MRQHTKNLVGAGAALAVAAGLGLYAWLGVVKADTAEAQRTEADARLLAGSSDSSDAGTPAQLVHVSVSAGGETTVLERGPQGAWQVTAPVQAAADGSTADALVSALGGARLRAVVEEAPSSADLARYGLAEPSFRVVARAEDGRTLALSGGRDSPFDGTVYVQRDGDVRVWSAEPGLRWALEKRLFDLRDKAVLAVKPEEVRRVELTAPGARWTLERGEGDAWRLVQPQPLTADGGAVLAYLRSLGEQRALAFPADTPETRRTLGLERPALELRLTLAPGTTVRLALAREPKGSKVHALREEGGRTLLAELPASALEALDKPARELRDLHLLAFRAEDVGTVKLTPEGGGPALALARLAAPDAGPEAWELTAPERKPAEGWKVSSLLSTLGALKAKGPAPARAQLGTPASRVELLGRDGRTLATLVVGAKVPGTPGQRYALSARGELLQVEESALQGLPRTPADVLPAPPPSPADGGVADTR